MIPRTLWMTLPPTVMLITFILFTLALNGILYAAIPLLGICYYEISYAIMAPTASKLYGLKHFGLIYSSMGLGNPTGALLVSGLLAGYAYDAVAAKQDSSACVGHDCFEVTFPVSWCLWVRNNLEHNFDSSNSASLPTTLFRGFFPSASNTRPLTSGDYYYRLMKLRVPFLQRHASLS